MSFFENHGQIFQEKKIKFKNKIWFHVLFFLQKDVLLKRTKNLYKNFKLIN
jgi:hypothetical protein